MAVVKTVVACSLITVLLWAAPGESKKCPADETRSLNDPNNLYDCPKDATCCFENGQPSCCTAKPMNDAVMDQIKLWGGLAAALVVVVIVVLTCRRDIEVCKEGTVCCPCCCKPKPLDNDEKVPIVSDNRARNMGPPDFTAPGTKKPTTRPAQHQDDGGHLHADPVIMPVQHQQPQVNPIYQPAAPSVTAPPPQPPKTAGFAAIMDMNDDDEFRF